MAEKESQGTECEEFEKESQKDCQMKDEKKHEQPSTPSFKV